jgi:GNAT superfamily N-acetyltransferase
MINTHHPIQIFTFEELKEAEQDEVFEIMNAKIEDCSSVIFAKTKHQCVGFLSLGQHLLYSWNEKNHFLERIEVIDSYKGKGIGSLLMLDAMYKAKEKGKDFFRVDIERPLFLTDHPDKALLKFQEKLKLCLELEKNNKRKFIGQFFEKISTEYEIEIEKRDYEMSKKYMVEIIYHLKTLKKTAFQTWMDRTAWSQWTERQ